MMNLNGSGGEWRPGNLGEENHESGGVGVEKN